MRRTRLFVFCILALCITASGVLQVRQSFASYEQQAAGVNKTRENAYRENNIGVALLEQFKYKEGGDQFRRALQPRLLPEHDRHDFQCRPIDRGYEADQLYQVGLPDAGQYQ